jgi:hypothetical protein
MPLPLAGESYTTLPQISHPTYFYLPERNTLVESCPIKEISQRIQSNLERLELLKAVNKLTSKKLKRTAMERLLDFRLDSNNLQNILEIDKILDFDKRFKIRGTHELEPHEQLTVHDLNKDGIFIPISSLRNEQVTADGLYITDKKWQLAEMKSRRASINSSPANIKNLIAKIGKITDAIRAQINSTIPNLPIKNKLGIIDVYTQEDLLTPIDFVAGINYTYEHEPSILPLRIRALDVSCRGQKEFSNVLFEVRCNPKPTNSSISPRIFTLKEFDSSLIC